MLPRIWLNWSGVVASIIVYHTQARRFSGRFPVAARTENHCPHCKPQAKGKQVLSGNQNWESLPSLQTEAKGKQRPENILVCCRPGFLGWKCQQVTRLPEVVGGLNDTFFLEKWKDLIMKFLLESWTKYFEMSLALGKGQVKETACILGEMEWVMLKLPVREMHINKP